MTWPWDSLPVTFHDHPEKEPCTSACYTIPAPSSEVEEDSD